MKKTVRVVHDIAHLAMLPFAAIVLLGGFNEAVGLLIERLDLIVHCVFFLFAMESIYEWVHHKKHGDE